MQSFFICKGTKFYDVIHFVSPFSFNHFGKLQELVEKLN